MAVTSEFSLQIKTEALFTHMHYHSVTRKIRIAVYVSMCNDIKRRMVALCTCDVHIQEV